MSRSEDVEGETACERRRPHTDDSTSNVLENSIDICYFFKNVHSECGRSARCTQKFMTPSSAHLSFSSQNDNVSCSICSGTSCKNTHSFFTSSDLRDYTGTPTLAISSQFDFTLSLVSLVSCMFHSRLSSHSRNLSPASENIYR